VWGGGIFDIIIIERVVRKMEKIKKKKKKVFFMFIIIVGLFLIFGYTLSSITKKENQSKEPIYKIGDKVDLNYVFKKSEVDGKTKQESTGFIRLDDNSYIDEDEIRFNFTLNTESSFVFSYIFTIVNLVQKDKKIKLIAQDNSGNAINLKKDYKVLIAGQEISFDRIQNYLFISGSDYKISFIFNKQNYKMIKTQLEVNGHFLKHCLFELE